MKTKNLPLLCLMLLCFGACEKDTPPKTAPPITQENTFSCKINGELFVPEAHGGFPITFPPISVTLHAENSWMFDVANERRDLYIYIYNVTTTGEYTITASDGNNDFFGEIENLVEMEDDLLDIDYVSINNDNKINVIELIPNKKIIFTFDTITLVNHTDPEDVIVLTEGKLHVNLETIIE